MFTVNVSGETEQSIRRLAMISGVGVEEVARVLIAIPLNFSPMTSAESELPYKTSPDLTDAEYSLVPGYTYNTAPDLTDDEYRSPIDSLGKRTPPGAYTPDDVDLRELAYDGIGE